MEIVIIVTLGILCGLLISALAVIGFVCRNLLKKIEKYEAWIKENEAIVIEVKDKVEKTYSSIKEIDTRGMFASDDDVGFIFTDIVHLIKKLNDYTKNL